jgi:uracil-DNA glycosylase
VDAKQETPQNPLGLDEGCQNCSVLVECRERVVHGIGADILLVGETPAAGAEATGIPFTRDGTGQGVRALLGDL